MAPRARREGIHVLTRSQRIEAGLPDRDTRLGVFESIVIDTRNGVVVTTPDGEIVFVNPAFSEITGYSRDHAIGKNMRMMQSGRQSKSFYQAMWLSIRTQDCWSGAIWNRRRDGEVYQEWLTVNAIKDEEQRTVAYVGIFSDISSIASREHLLERMAYFDPLTELPNQLLFHDRLTRAMVFARRDDHDLSVVVADVDRVDDINRRYGHQVGDRVLQQLARVVASELEDCDCVARTGGDEFTVLVMGGREHLDRIATRMCSVQATPDSESDTPITLTASVGVALYPADADTAADLVRHARAAMFSAKGEGGSRVRYYADVHAQQKP